MFIREKRRRQDGSGLPYLVLVETRPTPQGARQKILLSLGRIGLSRTERLTVVDMVARRLAGQQSVLEEPDSLKALADQIATKIRERQSKSLSAARGRAVMPEWTKDIALRWSRQIGPVAVIDHLWKVLSLEEISAQAGASPSDALLLKLAVCCRLLGFRLTDQGALEFGANCIGEWIPEASRQFRRRKVFVSERIVKNVALCENLLWRRQTMLFGPGESRLFLDLRTPCVNVLSDDRGLIVHHEVLRRGTLKAGALIERIRETTDRTGSLPTVVVDSRDVTERDLEMLIRSGAAYYVMGNLREPIPEDARILLRRAPRRYGTGDAHPDLGQPGRGDVYLVEDGGCGPGTRRSLVVMALDPGSAKGRGWFLRTNGKVTNEAVLLNDLRALSRSKDRFVGFLGHRPAVGLRKGAFIGVIACHIANALEEITGAGGDRRSWDDVLPVLRSHAAVCLEIRCKEAGAGVYSVMLSHPPDGTVGAVYRGIGMDLPVINVPCSP